MAFGLLGERESPKEDFYESTDFNNLESSLPSDTIKVATYVNKKYSTKKKYIFMCAHLLSQLREQIIKKYIHSFLLCGVEIVSGN